MIQSLSRSLSRLSLAAQFALAGGVVMMCAASLVGSWMATRIERDVVRNSAHAAALFMDSFLAPISQELGHAAPLSPGAKRALDEVFGNEPLASRIVAFRIWDRDGTVIAADDEALTGQIVPVSDNLRAAFDDDVRAEFRVFDGDTGLAPAHYDLPLLEVYSPVHEAWSGRIVAVAEFYELNPGLLSDLQAARRNAWVAVVAVMAGIGGLLFGIVLRGSRQIDRQTDALNRQVQELRDMSRANSELRRRVQNAAARVSSMNERALRRIGSDLHDGPAQLLALAALDLDPPEPDSAGKRGLKGLVDKALQDIRLISRGLLLPDINEQPLETHLANLIEAHENRTGATVRFDHDVAPGTVFSEAVRICAYRFVQEGLTNTWRHAGGSTPHVRLRAGVASMVLEVADRGPGLPERSGGDRMGLKGLRDRVESLGGTFEVKNRAGGGAMIRMTLELQEHGA